MMCIPSRRTITIGEDEYERLRNLEIRFRALEPIAAVERQPGRVSITNEEYRHLKNCERALQASRRQDAPPPAERHGYEAYDTDFLADRWLARARERMARREQLERR